MLFVFNQKVTPWKAIFTSRVCWATFIGHFCNNWGNMFYLTQLPSFMKDVLKFDIKSVKKATTTTKNTISPPFSNLKS